MNQAKPSKEANLCRVAKLWEAEIGKGVENPNKFRENQNIL